MTVRIHGSASVLSFEADTHVYRVGERELPSVTTVLKEAGLIDVTWFSEGAAERGRAVHAAIHLDTRGDFDPVFLEAGYLGYLEAYRRFMREGGFRVDASEEPLHDLVLGFAGTLDLRGGFDDADAVGYTDIIDIKTGSLPNWVGYQTAAYAQLFSVGRRYRRWALRLMSDGKYQLRPLTKTTDIHVFLAALTVVKAKRGEM